MSDKVDKSSKGWTRFGWSLLAAFLAAVAAGLLLYFGLDARSSVQGYALVGLGAAAGAIAIMALISIALTNLGLSNKDEPLGLPSGSIRAIIAIGLIVFFVILVIYYFQQIANPTYLVYGLTEAQVGNITASQILAKYPQGDGTYIVVLRNVVSEAGIDLAKQVLTILGTLVTAVSAFYFGSKAAAARILEAGTRLTSIKVTPGSTGPLDKDKERQFTATGTYANGSTADITSKVTWTSSDKTKATITSDGVATGKDEGNTEITASLAGVSGTADLQVKK